MRRFSLLSLFLIILSTSLFGLDYIRPYIQGNKVIFSFIDTQGKVKTAYLVGNLNNWNTRTLPLKRSLDGKRYSIAVDLEPGRYEYKFLINAIPFQDMSNPLSVSDGWGKANSVVYILSNNVLDWDKDEHFYAMEDGSWQLMESYPVNLMGFYRIDGQILDINDISIAFKKGLARLASTEKGVTGMIYWGSATLEDANNNTLDAHGLFMRFHPRFYEQKLSNLLQPVEETEEHMNCNNLYYLQSWSFFHVGDDFLIPPEDFVGMTISDKDYTIKKALTIKYQPQIQEIITDSNTIAENESVDKELRMIFRTWFEAVRLQDGTDLEPLVYAPIFSSIEQMALHMKALEDWELVNHSLQLRKIESGPIAQRLEDPYYLSATVRTSRGKQGLTRLLVARLGDRWQIVNFEITF